MKLRILKVENEDIKKDEIEIVFKFNKENSDEVNEIISSLNDTNNNKIMGYANYKVYMIDYKDIFQFYSENKNVYCKTNEQTYRINKKLYELENINSDFIRISKSCIININHVDYFDTSTTGKIIVELNDGTKENVSRRRIKDLLNFLEDKSIWKERTFYIL